MNTNEFEKKYQLLNPEQQTAVNALDGPVMVIAGPGTGKTQIIGMRTANIILKSGVEASNILITTFTEAGVIAIRERLISMIGQEAYKVGVSTIHSFAQDVIKTFPEKFTQEKLDTPIDDIECMELISEIVSEKLASSQLEYLTSYGDSLFYVRHIKTAIGNIKKEGITPKRFSNLIKEETERSLAWLDEKRNNKRIKKIEKYEQEHETNIGKLTELLDIYEKYDEALRQRHLYDFNDMINFVLEKFRSDEMLRAHYAETYQYIMLDEYQDTNNPQNEIIDLILSYGESKNLMVVGDDDQSIYRFQGANIENMLDFTSKYTDSKIIVLDKNYRSQQAILNSAQSLIEKNSERLISRIPGLKKDLFSQRDFELKTPDLYLATSEIDEKLYILQEIQKHLAAGVSPEEIAVIVRGNREVEEFSHFLTKNKLQVTSKLESNILENDYVKSVFSFIEILDNPYANDTAFINLLRSSLTGVESMDVILINNYLHRENYVRRGNKIKIFDVLRDVAALEHIGVQNPSVIHEFIEKYLAVSDYFSQHNFLLGMQNFFKEFQIIQHVDQNGSFDDTQDLYTLYHQIKKWTTGKNEFSIQDFLRKIDLYKKYGYRIERQASSEISGGIQIVTAHSSKGLEYQHVFVPGLYSGNWDSKSVRELIKLPDGIAGDGLQFAHQEDLSEKERKELAKDKQTQEDRRLFFVAITRAQYSLSLSFPASIGGKPKIISPFLLELGDVKQVESMSLEKDIIDEMQEELVGGSKLISEDEKEIAYISEFMKNYKLSASDLNTFLLNPRDFLYRTVFRYPFEENENSIFGTMYHRTLELFYKKILESGQVQDYEYMEFVFLRQLEREYLSSEERTRLKKRGLEALRGYYDCYTGTFTAPLKTEYKFSRRNIFFNHIPLTGIIDKIELVSEDYSQNISGGTLFSQGIRITDYKTGSTKYLGDIKGVDRDGNKDEGYERGRYGRQLLFYKLLFDNNHELNSQYNLEKLELDFCEGKSGKYKRQEVEFSQEEYEAFKQLVTETYSQMTDIAFWREILKNKETN